MYINKLCIYNTNYILYIILYYINKLSKIKLKYHKIYKNCYI